MRAPAWMSVVLVLVGCHPRYSVVREELVSDDGSGGSGGLITLRVKILAALASKDYEYARHLVQLAADLEEHERARFEQMISAAERNLVPFLEEAMKHIFREKEGHFPVDTAEARELIQTTVVESNFVGLKKQGAQVYQRILDTGVQIWVEVFGGTIRNAGWNDVPRSTERLLR